MTPTCHPDKPYKARGMCAACYARFLYNNTVAKVDHRVPVEPLLKAAEIKVWQLALRMDMDSGNLWHDIELGGFTSRQADRAAVACGLHPDMVWDDWWVEVEPQVKRRVRSTNKRVYKSELKDKTLEWVTEYLADGPKPSDEVKAAAKRAGISMRQLAREDLGIIKTFVGRHKTIWEMP